MTLIDHSGWLAALTQSREALDAALLTYKPDSLDRERVLVLTWQKGQVLYDRETGQQAEVISGTRKRIATLPST